MPDNTPEVKLIASCEDNCWNCAYFRFKPHRFGVCALLDRKISEEDTGTKVIVHWPIPDWCPLPEVPATNCDLCWDYTWEAVDVRTLAYRNSVPPGTAITW